MKRMLGCSLLIALALAGAAPAGVVQLRGNARVGMAVDAARSDWAGVPSFVDDSTNEPGIGTFDLDWRRLTMAHAPDVSLLYLRYETDHGADFGSFPAFYNVYLDADHDRNTGYIGGGSQFPIGADYLIQGTAVFSFGGVLQTDFSWNFVASGTVDNSYTNHDLELAVAPALFGNPASFDFILLADNELNGGTQDYYPDTANGGVGGGYFAYEFTALVTQPVFRAMAVTSVPALQIESQAGVMYQLQYSTNTPTPEWVYTGYNVQGNGSNLNLYDPTGFSAQKTYRVVVP